MSLISHHCHEARSMRTLWLLNELGVDFELKIYEFGKALRTPEYLAIHPLGRVPCLQDGDVTLFETGAIAEYLCEKFPDKNMGRFPGDPERVEYLQWLHYAETVGVHGATLTQQHIVIFEDKDRSPLLMKLERRRLEKALEVLDNQLKNRDYLLASGFSVVDIANGYSVLVASKFTALSAFPKLEKWFARISSRLAFKNSVPANPAIYQKPFYDLPEIVS